MWMVAGVVVVLVCRGGGYPNRAEAPKVGR